MEATTTEVTRASAITPACLTKSAAKTTSLSAPAVRPVSPRRERLTDPYNRQSHICLCHRKLVQRSLRGGLQERPEVQLRPRLPEVQAVLLGLPNLLRCGRWAVAAAVVGVFPERSLWSVHGFRVESARRSRLICACGVARSKLPWIKLSILPVLVITTEEISGGPSATEAAKSNSCHSVNHNSPKGIIDLMLHFQLV